MLSKGKNIVFNSENNSNSIFTKVSKGGYTYIFTSLEIAILKRFKKYILDQFCLTDYPCLLAVNEIYLVENWGKNFCPIYAEIYKV